MRRLPETITIIGGGLTGLSLAIALRKNGIPVTLHEAGTYPRHRVCGEFISGVAEDTLDTLGITPAFSDALHHRSVSWFSGNRLLRKTCLPDAALGISRYLLDDRLKELAIGAGTDVHTSSRITSKENDPGIVWTGGRKPAKGKWIGLKAHIRGIGITSHLEMHSGPHGYLGITPVEDGWHNACGLFRIDRSIAASHEELLPAYLRKNGNTHLSEAITSAEWREKSFSAIAGFHLGLQKQSPGRLCLGDSHSIIPPFTGNGMTMAFQSAESALPHLISFASGKASWSDSLATIESALRNRFKKRLTAANLLHPLLFHPVARPLLKIAPLTPILHLVR